MNYIALTRCIIFILVQSQKINIGLPFQGKNSKEVHLWAYRVDKGLISKDLSKNQDHTKEFLANDLLKDQWHQVTA